VGGAEYTGAGAVAYDEPNKLLQQQQPDPELTNSKIASRSAIRFIPQAPDEEKRNTGIETAHRFRRGCEGTVRTIDVAGATGGEA
jgi:hypothetical protein